MARALRNERLGHGTEALAQAALAHSELGGEGSILAYADILLAEGNLQRALRSLHGGTALAHSELGGEGNTLAYADILLAEGNLQRALDVLQAQRRAQPHSLRIAEAHLGPTTNRGIAQDSARA